MDRIECEKKIMALLGEVFNVYQTYNPRGSYLTLVILRDDKGIWCSFNNECWPDGEDSAKPVDKHMYLEVQ